MNSKHLKCMAVALFVLGFGAVSGRAQVTSVSFHATSTTGSNTFLGNVSIDGSTPRGKLHVQGSGTTDPATLVLGAANGDDNTESDLRFVEDTDGSGIMTHGARFRYDPTANAFMIYMHSGSTSGVEYVRIDRNTGRMGLGTNSPAATLHVVGTARFQDGITYVGALGDLSMGTFTTAP